MSEITQDQQVKNLKRFLEGWRPALLPLKSVFLWEQQWHPCAIFAGVSLLYLVIWLMDLNTLATFAMVGLLINFLDFIVPIIFKSVSSPNSWTGQHDKMYEELCRSLVGQYNKTIQQFSKFYSLRENSPVMYYVISISMLFVLAWLASSINNVFLLYIFSTVVLLWPGIQHRGMFNALFSMINKSPKLASMKSE